MEEALSRQFGVDVALRQSVAVRDRMSAEGVHVNIPYRRIGRVLASTMTILLIGCDGPPSALQPAGRGAEKIASLFWVMTTGGEIIWSLAAGRLVHVFVAAVAVFIGNCDQCAMQWELAMGIIGGATLAYVWLGPLPEMASSAFFAHMTPPRQRRRFP